MTTIAVPAPAPLPTLVTRISPAKALGDGLKLAGRVASKVRKNPQMLLDVTIQPIIFLLMFVFLFGGAIEGSTHAYLQLLLPGLLVQNTTFVSLGTGVALCTDLTNGVFDRFRSMPIARSAPLVGVVLGDVVRYLVALAVLLGTGMLMGFRPHTDPGSFVLAVGLVVAFGLCLCWVSVWVGLLVKSPQAVPGALLGILFPLTFGSNVFVAADTLPGWLQGWVHINPISHLTSAVRGLMLGGDWAADAGWAFLWALAIFAIAFPMALRAYGRRVG